MADTSQTLWPDLPARLVARMLSAHAGIGIVLGALLYIVSLSGVLVVFHAEFARWEQPDAPEYEAVSAELTQIAVEQAYQHALDAGVNPDRVQAFLPTPDSPRLIAGYGDHYFFVDETGALGEEVHHGFSEFLIDLHYYLHLPSTLGLIVVGLLGVMMLGLVMSGFLAHPRIFKDAFRTSNSGNTQLTLSDRHNRLSVWGAPFHAMIPLTGAALGLASIVAVSLAMTQPDEDASSLFDTIFGARAEAPGEAGSLPNAAQAIRSLQAEYGDAGLEPWIIQIEHPGQDGQHLQMIAAAPQRLIFGEYIKFDTSGQIIGKTGLDDGSFGQQATASVYNLHFGNWGGVPVKTVYVVLGLVLCVVCVSGVQLWLHKRARKKGPQPHLHRSWTALVWAPPALIGLVLVLNRLLGLSDALMPAVFWLGLLGCVLMANVMPGQALISRGLRASGGLLIMVGALSHFAAYGFEGYQAPAAWGVMIGIVLTGLALLTSAVVPALKPVKTARTVPG